jgi:putative Flp pilus-assembly TadE/G-like protein
MQLLQRLRDDESEQRRRKRERGATLVLVAVAMTALFGFLALAIDLGMLFVAHSDAQRAADAAALAGASAFLDSSSAAAVGPARQRALEYAMRNTFQNGPIDSSDVAITVLPDSGKVGVYIHRDSVRTLFAGVLGIRSVPVAAFAAAQAIPSATAKCLKPFAIPDMWYDANGDANGNRVWDNNETWVFGDNPADRYLPYSGPGGSPLETGYGSAWRNSTSPGSTNDFGRQISIKAQDPKSPFVPQPGVFMAWQLPVDPLQLPCKGSFGGGASAYRNNICSCNNSSIKLGTPYPIETGDMKGPTFQGVGTLINQDPGAYWDQASHSVKGSSHGADWMDSPRVVKVALFAPGQLQKSGMQSIVFNNVALLFLEGQQTQKDPVVGRFLYYARGTGETGPVTGSLVKSLKLVK